MPLVTVEVTTRIEIDVLEGQTADHIEFRYNEGTWCVGNLPDLIQAHIDRQGGGPCPGYEMHANTHIKVISSE